MFKFSNAWGALGAMLGLVGLYLLLNNSKAASTLFRGGAGALNSTFAVLQGRDAKVANRS